MSSSPGSSPSGHAPPSRATCGQSMNEARGKKVVVFCREQCHVFETCAPSVHLVQWRCFEYRTLPLCRPRVRLLHAAGFCPPNHQQRYSGVHPSEWDTLTCFFTYAFGPGGVRPVLRLHGGGGPGGGSGGQGGPPPHPLQPRPGHVRDTRVWDSKPEGET